jgi:beta-barrel assembly-enhancing protease
VLDKGENAMIQRLQFLIGGFWIVPLLAILSTTSMAQAPVPEPITDQETELGKATYDQLRNKVEIIESSPLYDSLKPVAEAISRVSQSRYPHPFKFFLVHEAQPNAFATPGGNVYVVDSLLYFVKNTEQLAGTLCHEVSHTIHRDAIALMKKERHIAEREAAAAILLGPTRAELIAIALLGKLHSLGYARDAESKADVTGSDICAEAGYNPWGLAWLFQDFQNAVQTHPATSFRPSCQWDEDTNPEEALSGQPFDVL